MDQPQLLKLLTFLPDRFLVLLPTGEEESLKNIVFLLNIFRAPTDCVQYFTGTAGSVKSYNYAGGQILAGQRYNNCIRTEKGYCAIQWKESSTTSPDPFGLDSITGVAANGAGPGSTAAPADVACDTAYINIPTLRRLIKIHLYSNIFCLLILFLLPNQKYHKANKYQKSSFCICFKDNP